MAQHVSIRVPWHDAGWKGCVCDKPEFNQACRALTNIASHCSDLSREQCLKHASEPVVGDGSFMPPCFTESGMFMSGRGAADTREHPYSYDQRYKHILPSRLSSKPYSFMARPYKWTLKTDWIAAPYSIFYTGFESSREIEVGSNNWISSGVNQRHIFDYFYRDVLPGESVVAAYAKSVPFVESSGRILIGLGMVESVGELKEYDYASPPSGDMATAFFWERNIVHSIRNDRKNGFLFPFDEIRKYLADNPRQNPDELVVFAPEDYVDEFSYATEHLSHDALIFTLNKTAEVLKKYEAIGLPPGNGADWRDCALWCEEQLEKAWRERGAYPGLGAVLSALGCPYGFDVAKVIRAKCDGRDLWKNIAESVLNLPSILPERLKGILKSFTTTRREDLAEMLEEKNDYFQLLSRVTLTLPQAELLTGAGVKKGGRLDAYADKLTDIHLKDQSQEIIDNPYLLFEKTYLLEEKYRVGIGKIDLAFFPPEFVVGEFFPEDDLKRVRESDDKRRLRAVIVSVLEREAASGSSLMLASDLVEAVGKFRTDILDSGPEIRRQTIGSKSRGPFFEESFVQFPVDIITESGELGTETAAQLVRLKKIDDVIRGFVDSRSGQTLDVEDRWDDLLDGVLKGVDRSEKDKEDESRLEKVAAIGKMARSAVSVLTGGAGTGKTTTLAALCKSKSIQAGGVLLLAPTGKARVVLSSKFREESIPCAAKTVFQFLRNSGHCDESTWSYYLSGQIDPETPETVIVDESSMLTEEMFAGLVEAARGARRVVFVGDPNQLPPIGTGKPFYDLVRKMKNQDGRPHHANLTVSNRQKQGGKTGVRLDLELSKLFTEDQASQVPEDLFRRISAGDENIEFIPCDGNNSVEPALELALSKIGVTDVESFDRLLGGELDKTYHKWMNFESAVPAVDWQILSPFRNKEIAGTRAINAIIQSRYRIPKPASHRGTRSPLGVDGIRYGEKVINVQNQDRSRSNPGRSLRLSKNQCENYIANGEIGLVTGLGTLEKSNAPRHQVQFATQDGYIYYFDSSVSETPPLELAYALTVHKAQGSGFKSTILVLAEPERGTSPMVTREMLYTALTRQSDKIFIIYNKNPHEIRKYADAEHSDLAHRKTNLFGETVLRQVKDVFYDSNHIFVTVDGTRVLSKSEVIVYNMLFEAGLGPVYERELRLGDVAVHPDFTIATAKGDIFWEHLGMLGDYAYRKDWERKERTYAEHGISEALGNLVLSKDELNGSIDSTKIKALIEKIKKR